MFRDETIDVDTFSQKFTMLKEKLDDKEEVHLDSEYHRNLKEYIGRLYRQTVAHADFDEQGFCDIREAEMSNLNRLQKMKNGTSYKKDKHKSKHTHEDWG